MTRLHVLTVESYDDPSTRVMLSSLFENEKFRDFELHHCFIEKAFNPNELFAIIEQAVREHNASVLLIHMGVEFHRLINFFPEVIQKLRENFVDLRIGVQYRERLNKSVLDVVDSSEEVIELERKFFAIRR